jgi:hypothetical protein
MHSRVTEIFGAVLLIAVLAGLGYWWAAPGKLWSSSGPSWQRGDVVRSTSTGLWRLQWGYQDDEVRYVALVHDGSKEPPELMTVTGFVPTDQTMLCLPGKDPVACPHDFNVFQLVDGKFDQQKIPLTVEQVKKYCDTKMDRYTIETLKDFLAKEP